MYSRTERENSNSESEKSGNSLIATTLRSHGHQPGGIVHIGVDPAGVFLGMSRSLRSSSSPTGIRIVLIYFGEMTDRDFGVYPGIECLISAETGFGEHAAPVELKEAETGATIPDGSIVPATFDKHHGYGKIRVDTVAFGYIHYGAHIV